MGLDELLTLFARNNDLGKLEQNNGRYQITMETADVACYEEAGQVYLLCNLGVISEGKSQRQSDNRLLLEKSMGLIRDQRGSLTMDETEGVYQLYQRMALSDLRIEQFQEAVEAFGGCCLYYQGLLGRSSGDNNFSAPAPGNIMMP